MAPALAAVLPCLPLLSLLPAGETLWFRDFSLYFVPMKALLVDLWRSGHVPLWDPYVRNGLPFLANPQTGVFYPPSLLLVAFGLNPGLTLFILLHFAAAGAGFYLFLRAMRLPAVSSLFGAIALGLGGYLASLVNVLNNLQAAAWIPWMLFFSVRLGEPPRRKSWIGFTLALTLSLLGGELQLTALGAGLALALLLVLDLPGGVGSPDRVRSRPALMLVRERLLSRLAWAALLCLAAVVASGLAAVQLLPTAELLRESVRHGGLPLELAARDAFDPASLFSLAFPRPALPADAVAGTGPIGRMPWLLSAYMGVAVVWLAAIGIFGSRRAWTLVWCSAALTGVLLALGSLSPLFRFLFELVPPFRSVRFPEKFLLLTAVALPALGAAGVERVLAGKIGWRGLVLGGVIVIPSGTGSLLWMEDFARPHPATAALTGLLLGASVLTLLLLARSGRVAASRAAAVLCAIAALDLIAAARGVNPGVPWRFYDKPWAARVLDAENVDSRAYRVRSTPLAADMEQVAVVSGARLFSNHYFFHQSLAPNLGQLYGFLEQDGMSGIETRGSADLIDALLELGPPGAIRLLELLSVRYAVTSFPLPGQDVVQVAEHPELPVAVVRLRGSLPRAYFAFRWEVIPEPRAALRRALEPGFAAREEVVLAREPNGVPAAAAQPSREALHARGAPAGVVRHASWEPAAMDLDVELARAGVLVVTDSYYPGWRAAVDGHPAALLRANGYQRAVAVPAGTHRVTLRYAPSSFTRGAVISLASVLLLGVIALPRSRRRSRGGRRDETSSREGGPAPPRSELERSEAEVVLHAGQPHEPAATA